jgi:hypothetical protein
VKEDGSDQTVLIKKFSKSNSKNVKKTLLKIPKDFIKFFPAGHFDLLYNDFNTQK